MSSWRFPGHCRNSGEYPRLFEVAARNRVIRKALHLYDSRGTSQVLNDLPAIYPFIDYVMVTDPDGRVFAVSTRDRDGRKIQGEQLLLKSLEESPMLAPPAPRVVAAGIPGNDPFLPNPRSETRPDAVVCEPNHQTG